MEFLKKVNPISIALFVVILVAGLYYSVTLGITAGTAFRHGHRLQGNIATENQRLEEIKLNNAQKVVVPETVEKVIYQSQGLQFGSDASFAPLFEAVLDIAKGTGIRIRSINYVYQPGSDPIVASGLSGYNICELNIVAVGTYSEFQNFYKNVLREHYLTYFAEVEVKPWDSDKSILITEFKLRLYTRT